MEKLRGSVSLEEEMHVQRKIKEKPQAEEKQTEGQIHFFINNGS